MEYRSFLDRVRWVAALIVAFGHALALLNSEARGAGFITIVADMRGPAVTVFFMLSGYLVGGSVQKAAARFDWRAYFIARFARIYIVLVPAILLTVLVDGAVRLFDPGNPVFARVWQNDAFGDPALFDRYGAVRVAGTILSLEPFTGVAMGSAASLWSLGFEWVFYFLFPTLWIPATRRFGTVGGVVAVVLSVAVLAPLPRMFALFWVVWLMGAAAYGLERRRVLRGPFALVVRSVAALVLVAYVAWGEGIDYRVMLPLAGFAGMVFLASGRQGEARMARPFDAALAHFSYSLYATHLQLMAGMAALMVRAGVLPETGIVEPMRVLAWAAVMTGVSAGVAYGFGRVFESRTADLARYLRGLAVKRSPG